MQLSPPPLTASEFKAALPDMAKAHGFDTVGVARAEAAPARLIRLEGWLEAGNAGEMDWLAREPEKRASPPGLWPEARSVIMLGVSYAPADDPLADLAHQDHATLALYALRKDYHDVIKSRLKAFAREMVEKAGGSLKVFVDTAPVMEKPLAMQAGLGWQGKHTVLVSRTHGNWLLLGAIYTTLDLEPDAPGKDHCGTCRRCLTACPTNAFPKPYTLETQRCIAYLTIEHKGVIARDLRPAFGNRVFGCDDCLAVCPWNRFAKASQDAKLNLRADLRGMKLADLARLDDAAFRTLFAGTPVKRTGRARFVRNVLIAIGNSGDYTLADVVKPLLTDESPLVRAMAVWALFRLLPQGDINALAAQHLPNEPDDDVRAEWMHATQTKQDLASCIL